MTAIGCSARAQAGPLSDHEALAWEKLEDGRVRCTLCPRSCVVPPGRRGYCRVRENRGGTLYTLTYGRLVSANVDPVEKKPLFHVHPGSTSLSGSPSSGS